MAPRQIVLAELLLLGLVLSVFVWSAVKVCLNPYLPSSAINDGFGYYMGAKSFYLNHQLRGAVLHLDNVSLVGEFYSHGFGYSLINGGVAMLVGWHDKLIIAINIVLLAAAVVFILTRGYSWPWKLAFALVFLTYFITPTMTFAYMQDIVHLLLTLMIGHLLLVIVEREEVGRRWDLLVGYCILIAAIALIRPTWTFWAAGLLAIVRSRRDLVVFGSLALAYVGLGYLFLKLFYAPFPYYSPHTQTFAALSEHRIVDAVRAYFEFLSENLSKLFSGNLYIFGLTHIPNAYTFLVIGLTAYSYYRYHRDKDRLALAVACVATPYVLAFMFIYDSLSAARHMSVVFVLQLTYLVATQHRRLIVGLTAAQLALFPAVIAMTDRIINVQIDAGRYAVENPQRLDAIRNLASAVRIGRPATIYVDNVLTNSEYPINIHLPFRSADGQPLRYSLDLYSRQPMAMRTFDDKFLDFVLSAEQLHRPDLTPAYEANNLHLYKLQAD